MGVIFILAVFFSFLVNISYAAETYVPGEAITIGEFIYNDDYTPSTDDCTISIYSPAGATLVNEATMTDNASGWHYYPYTTPGVEGKYPTFITCGTLIGGDLMKLDKSFVLKNSVVTDSSIATSVWASGTRTLSSFGSLVSDTASSVWSSPTRDLTGFGTLVSDIWANGTRTLTSGAAPSAADIWSYGTRNLTDATLSSGSLATLANVTSATSPLATAAMLTAVKASTDTIDWSDITTIKNNVATLITEIGTGNIAAIKTSTDDIAWADIDGIVTDTGLIKAKTDTIAWANVADIKTKTDTIDWANVTGIKTKTDTILWTDIAALATSAELASAVTDINDNTDANTTTITNAIAALNDITAADVWANGTRTLTSSSAASWSATTSDFGSITAGSKYLALLTTVFDGTLTDSANLPTVTIYDPSRNVVVSGVPMTKTADGIYSYSYTTAGAAEAGTWETVFSVTVEPGKTLSGNDYWSIATSPAQVIINSISDNIIPQVSANVTVTNEGLTGYEYQYEWCVVSTASNVCGGGDDVFHGLAAKYINPGEDFNTTLTADVLTAGNYYFKLVVYFGTESSGASRSFAAVAGAGGAGGAGGGGGGGGAAAGALPDIGTCSKPADFNCDNKVNSIDFSILLFYWKSQPPFKNAYVDMNKDGKIDSVDFSILLYRWDK